MTPPLSFQVETTVWNQSYNNIVEHVHSFSLFAWPCSAVITLVPVQG